MARKVDKPLVSVDANMHEIKGKYIAQGCIHSKILLDSCCNRPVGLPCRQYGNGPSAAYFSWKSPRPFSNQCQESGANKGLWATVICLLLASLACKQSAFGCVLNLGRPQKKTWKKGKIVQNPCLAACMTPLGCRPSGGFLSLKQERTGRSSQTLRSTKHAPWPLAEPQHDHKHSPSHKNSSFALFST